jgi:hypothetical protein
MRTKACRRSSIIEHLLSMKQSHLLLVLVMLKGVIHQAQQEKQFLTTTPRTCNESVDELFVLRVNLGLESLHILINHVHRH